MRRAAGLGVDRTVVAVLFPLSAIVAGLTLLGLESHTFELMAGIDREPRTPAQRGLAHESAWIAEWLGCSGLGLFPVFGLLWVAMATGKGQPARTAQDAQTAQTAQEGGEAPRQQPPELPPRGDPPLT